MYRILLFIVLFQGLKAYGQTCPMLIEPRDGDVDVPVDSPVHWSQVSDAVGYVISLGTSPGDVDIINNRSSGLRNYYVPETGLPADTQIYMTIGYFKGGREFVTCEVETFRTAAVTSAPGCTTLSEPVDGTSDVALETKLKWVYAPTATGYLLSAGTTLGGSDVFDNLDVGNVLEFKPPEGLPADAPIYVTLTPYNEIGLAEPCPEEGFTTTSTLIDCGPYKDVKTGVLVSQGPKIDFPDKIGLCRGETTITAESHDKADGYRWYALNPDGSETLLSSTYSVVLSSIGKYRYEAYNEITQRAGTVECAKSKIFDVIASESATITSIDDGITFQGRNLEVYVLGEGPYEFALDDIDGPYQDSPVFVAVTSDSHTVYVRDKNGCGIVQSSVPSNLGSDNFPNFFTPNGDNVNDYWQFIVLGIEDEIVPNTIEIFDRYGALLARIDPKSKGWDGTVRGRPMPSSDYWFRATTFTGREVKGHFSLKR